MYLKDKDFRVNVRLSEEDFVYLRDLALLNGLSMSAMLRQLLLAFRAEDERSSDIEHS